MIRSFARFERGVDQTVSCARRRAAPHVPGEEPMTRTRRTTPWRAVAVVAAPSHCSPPAAAAAGRDAKDGGSTTTKPAKATSLPKVTIEAADFSFKAPATIPAGYVDVTVKNTGKEGHQVQFVKLGDGVTFDAVQDRRGEDRHRLAQHVDVRRRSQRRRSGRLHVGDRQARPGHVRARVLHPRHRRPAARRPRDDRRRSR